MKSTRITVEEIAQRLEIGERAVYELLESGQIPSARLNRRYLIARYAYEQWEKTFQASPERELTRRLA